MGKMKQNVIGIYGIEDTETGNIYCGQSTDIAKRWSNHSSFLKSGIHRYKELQEPFNKDCKRIKYTILEECSEEMLQEREDFWFKYIKKIDGWNLINKQEHGGNHNTKVKDTSKMCKAQTGEKNGNCRLRKEDVIEIKKLLIKGAKVKDLAREYNVSQTQISKIKNGQRWSSVRVEEDI